MMSKMMNEKIMEGIRAHMQDLSGFDRIELLEIIFPFPLPFPFPLINAILSEDNIAYFYEEI